MTSRRMLVVVCVIACIVGASMAVAAVTLDDFERVLTSIPVASEARVIAALELGLKSSCCGFPADETYRLFTRLADGSGSAADKETVILIVTHAIEEGIPIDSLLNKANEGLARAVSLTSLAQLLQQRLRLLEESRDLFWSYRIFRATPGAPVAAGATALSTSRFDSLLSNVGDALGDYLESGGSPFESQQIYDQVQARLTLLAGSVLSAEDVDTVLSRISPADLAQIVRKVLT
ncbi:MAG: hypothetical protein NTV92_05825 [Candidatus Bipolaricaulota bacterium]|nr:hypothetical protein [Candidatus Bipolaricaulota bacterium]